MVNLDCKEIQALIRKIVPEAESAILVLDQEGNPVTCVNAAAEELMREPELLSRLTAAKNTVLDVRLDGKRYYGVARKVSVTPWTIVCLQASTTAREESRSYLQLLLVEGGTLIMVTGIVCLLMLHWFTAPLRELINCQNVRQEFCYEGNDEIALLTKSYNQMLRSSNEMLDREKQYSHQLEEKNDAIELEQRLKRRAELQALQAQINPHFCITRWTPSGGRQRPQERRTSARWCVIWQIFSASASAGGGRSFRWSKRSAMCAVI